MCRPSNYQFHELENVVLVDSWVSICCSGCVLKLDQNTKFDLMDVGRLTCRIGRDLEIPPCGFPTGGDVRAVASSVHGKVIRAIKNLFVKVLSC